MNHSRNEANVNIIQQQNLVHEPNVNMPQIHAQN